MSELEEINPLSKSKFFLSGRELEETLLLLLRSLTGLGRKGKLDFSVGRDRPLEDTLYTELGSPSSPLDC